MLWWLVWLIGATVWLGPDGAREQKAPPDSRLAGVAEYLAEERQKQHIPGMSVAVVLEGALVWSGGFGLADVENEVPATPRTVYRFAAISRMITATAVLQLIQKGKIGLNAPIRDYVPELPDKGERITVEHLLTHLSGIRAHATRDVLFNRKHYIRIVDSIEVFKDAPLLAKPGQRFINTPFGYTLLGLLVERVSRMTFDDYLRVHLFEPSGMQAAGVEDLITVVPHRARGYLRKKDGTLINSYFVDLSDRYPSDGLVGTVEDLARFAIALMSDKLLDPEMFKVMTTEYQTRAGFKTHYGMGCFVREEAGRRIIGHGGWLPQVTSFLLIVPDRKAAVAVLTNLEQADVKAISLTVMNRVLGEGVTLVPGE